MAQDKTAEIVNIKDVYEIKRILGKGSYGEIREVLHKPSKNLRALKVIYNNTVK